MSLLAEHIARCISTVYLHYSLIAQWNDLLTKDILFLLKLSVGLTELA